MRGNRYTTASINCLRGRTSDMDLDKNQDSGNTTHTPHTRTSGMDPTPDLPSLALPKTGGDYMDRSPSSSIPSPDRATPLSNDYMDFLQRARWKVYHRAAKTPIVEGIWMCYNFPLSPLAPDSFKTGLKCDSMAPYIFDNNISHSLKTHHGWR